MRKFLLGAALIVAGCSKSPSGPSQPTIAQVGGVWIGTGTLTSVSGGECVGSALASAIGSRSTATVAINQSGASLSATVTSQSNGTACTYTGTAGSSTVSLNMTNCQAGTVFGIRCANGSVRDIRILADGITATVNGNSATGTEAETYNVTSSTTGAAIATMTLNSTFVMTR